MSDKPAAAPPHWPDPNERDCDDCGHVWFAGERRHHYADPQATRPEDSDVVCGLCGQQRRRPRSHTRWVGF